MGNVPAKEGRSRANSYASGSSSAIYADGSSHSRSSRRNTTASIFATAGKPAVEGKKSKSHEEKERQRELHYSNLVVRFGETVDGGYLAPYGTYKSNLDYNTEIVRDLIVSRRLAPFYTPLQDFDPDWTDDELVILLSQLSLHSIEVAYSDDEEVDDIDNHKIHKSSHYYRRQEQKARLQALVEKTKIAQKDEENRFTDEKLKLRDPELKPHASSFLPSRDLMLKLYRDASECPICFLYYPPYLNVSRCCRQPICTECFVQIKRLDPHPPHDDSSNDPGCNELPHTIISEPSNCPYCAMPDFGVTYEPPRDIHTGVNSIKPADYQAYGNGFTSIPESSEAIISSSPEKSDPQTHASSPQPPQVSHNPPRKPRRRSSVAADSPNVITTDAIRPDWEQRLASARNKLARKAATASAIHASNLIIPGEASSSDNVAGSGSAPRGDRYPQEYRNSTSGRTGASSNNYGNLHSVEERMIEQALRLSLLDEEERKKKAEAEERKK